MFKRLGIVTRASTLNIQDMVFQFTAEALRRADLEVYSFDSTDLMPDGSVRTRRVTKPITHAGKHEFDSGNHRIDLRSLDGIFLRKDIPIDDSYKRLLDTLAAFEDEVPTVNSPQGIAVMGTKTFLKKVPELTPPTVFARSPDEVIDAIRDYGATIVKQSDGYGGKQVTPVFFDGGRYTLRTNGALAPVREREVLDLARSYLKNSRDHTVLVVKYLPSATTRGDKRVIVVAGDTILGSYIRLPDEGTGLGACDSGAAPSPPTERDEEIVRALTPYLVRNKVLIAGLDLLADDNGLELLSEVNIVNPGFFNLTVLQPELQAERRIMQMIVDNMTVM